MEFKYNNLLYINNIKRVFWTTVGLALMSYFFVNMILAAIVIIIGLTFMTIVFSSYLNTLKFTFRIEDRCLRIIYDNNVIDFPWEEMKEIKNFEKHFSIKIHERELILIKNVDDRSGFVSCILEKSKEYKIPIIDEG